jgi:hypothetical protein
MGKGIGVPERQRAFLDRLARRAGDLPWVTAAVVIGSMAGGRGDAASDVDLLVAVDDVGDAWQHRHALHVTGAVLAWDHGYDGGRGVGAHKWVTSDLVLVEALVATPTSGVRLAPPWRLLAGDPDIPATWPGRPPITRAELATGLEDLHPVEVAFDAFKAELRRAR